jgi:hypothetical protein
VIERCPRQLLERLDVAGMALEGEHGERGPQSVHVRVHVSVLRDAAASQHGTVSWP